MKVEVKDWFKCRCGLPTIGYYFLNKGSIIFIVLEEVSEQRGWVLLHVYVGEWWKRGIFCCLCNTTEELCLWKSDSVLVYLAVLEKSAMNEKDQLIRY